MSKKQTSTFDSNKKVCKDCKNRVNTLHESMLYNRNRGWCFVLKQYVSRKQEACNDFLRR